MLRCAKIVAAVGIGLVSIISYVHTSKAQQNTVTAIDIALEPDATMMQHAQADNARLRKASSSNRRKICIGCNKK